MKNNRPLKIAFDVSPMLVNKTGVAFYIERLMVNLAKHYPNDVEIVAFYYNFLGKRSTKHFPMLPNIRYRPVSFIPSKIIYQLRRWGIEIPLEILIKERVDFVLFSNFLGYPSINKTPAAPVVHDLTYLDLPDYVATKNRNDLTRFVPQQIKRSKFLVTVSQFSKKKILDTYSLSEDDVLVTPIPVQPPQKLPEKIRIEHIQKLGITKPFILFLSTIEPRKNLVNLIDAYALLPVKLRGKYTLVVTGRIGWNCDAEIARLKSATEEGLDVVHMGYVSDEDREALLQSADLYVSSSNYEGFGMTVLEAMSYGRPCAVSDIEVFHEVAHDAARYFDQTQPKKIASTIGDLLNNPQQMNSMSQQSLKQVQQFSWDDVAKSLFDKITKTLS